MNRRWRGGGYTLLETLVASAVLALGMVTLFTLWGAVGAGRRAEEEMRADSEILAHCSGELRTAFDQERPQNVTAARELAGKILIEAGCSDFELREEGRIFTLTFRGRGDQVYVVQIKKTP
ncbi:MAG: hypothetical protein Q4C55_03615 [Eubacterium sp.]|nr:hypothetical protein [Eubacterium sp.]